MKCLHCKKEVNDFEPKEFSPDFDVFHKACYPKYVKERDRFFNEIVHDDNKFNNWMNK